MKTVHKEIQTATILSCMV